MEASIALHEIDPEDDHGEVFTRRWVVELILDLVGYTPDKDLAEAIAVEPACGFGAFLIPMIERLLQSARAHSRPHADLERAIAAYDLLPGNVEGSRQAAEATLVAAGVDVSEAGRLARSWLRHGDFLLDPPGEATADFVVGNPPYIRLEAVPPERSAAYRRACFTMGGRADVYVGFYERGLLSLRPGGTLGFICADRWMRNAYGARLRQLVTSGFAVSALISMTGVDAFEDEVDAYPAITVLTRERQTTGPLVVEAQPGFNAPEAAEVVALAGRHEAHESGVAYRAARLHSWFEGDTGWPHGSPDRLSLIADLEARFPPLEDADTRTKVGIGVATGADKIFIVRDPNLMEIERLLPLALPRDIANGTVNWSGKFLVNPWDPSGLVELDDWPRFAAYMREHREALEKRHTARRGRWHKTIDRVTPSLTLRPKLYLPDFKEMTFPVLDEGRTYPHHNLYWITSDQWDLRVLGGLLLSDVANLFIEAYSVRMRGGFLRFQAQYLRRIRVPEREQIDPVTAEELATAFSVRDRVRATTAAMRLYGLDHVPAT